MCVFFFPRKSSLAIHSFDFKAVFFFPAPEIKKNSFFIHSFEIHQKCTKKNFSGEIKKYDTFGLPSRKFQYLRILSRRRLVEFLVFTNLNCHYGR